VRGLVSKGLLGTALCLGTLVVCALLNGCGVGHRASQEREQSNLKPLAVFYGQFIGQHRGQPPANEKEFKEFIRSLGAKQVAGFDVSDVDSLFISSRDQKPYVVLYGKNAPLGKDRVVAYEQEGKGGKRFLATDVGNIQEVDEARFKEMVPGAK
jgi:hypothetical protein